MYRQPTSSDGHAPVPTNRAKSSFVFLSVLRFPSLDGSLAAIGFDKRFFTCSSFLYSLVPGQIQLARYEKSPLAQRPIKLLLLLLLLLLPFTEGILAVLAGAALKLCNRLLCEA